MINKAALQAYSNWAMEPSGSMAAVCWNTTGILCNAVRMHAVALPPRGRWFTMQFVYMYGVSGHTSRIL